MLAITNGKIQTITQGIIENGTVLIEGNKIKEVGANVAIPADATVIDARGGWVTPGLIDVHTHLAGGFVGQNTMPGDADLNEGSDPITPNMRAIDFVNPFDFAVEKTRDAGFTTVYTMPGSANLIGGMGTAIKLRGKTADQMAIPGTETMKFALGENPKRFYGANGKAPKTRMGSAGMVRETLTKAIEYSDALKAGDKPKFDAKLHALVPVVRGEMLCRMHAHRADDIMTHVRIAKEFGLKFVIEHATEGWKVADVLASEGVTCIVGPMTIGMIKRELWELRLDNTAQLEQAGVNFCITEDDALATQYLPSHIGLAMREGLSEQTAFEAVTIRPAKVMGLEHRIGSLEAGKDADVAVFGGHPFCNMSPCQLVVIDGEVYKNML